MPLWPVVHKVLGRMAGTLKGPLGTGGHCPGTKPPSSYPVQLVALRSLVQKKDWTSPLPDGATYQAQALPTGTWPLLKGEGILQGGSLI